MVAALCLLPLSGHTSPAINGHIKAGFADLVEELMPAVVNVSTTQTVKKEERSKKFSVPDLPPGSLFENFQDFFEEFYDNLPGEDKAHSLGSGFVVDPSGYIVTNNHVIESADEVIVTFHDDSQLNAEVVGRDSKTDLALLKVTTDKPLPALKFGDSDKSRIGDWVIVIGNPFGFGGSVSAGIISAIARDINSGPFDDFIQTDAAINRGNSGGPMFNEKGEVIGISTAIYTPSGGSIGIGFAVPSTLAQPIIEQLREHGKTMRAWLGVKIQTVTQEIADSLELDSTEGALVLEVSKDSPAKKAGVEVGDIIIQFDGKEIPTMKKLPRMVAETEIGKKTNLIVLRKGKKRKLTVALGELDEGEEKTASLEDSSSKEEKELVGTEILGMEVVPNSSSIKEKFQLPSDRGLFVSEVERDSIAFNRGIRKHDVILSINQNDVSSVKSLQKRIKKAKKNNNKYVLLLVGRGERTQFLTLPLEEESSE